MNPLRIEISNMGAVTNAEHDLSNISLVAVVGVNGSGKSTTFTLAPTWILFGTTKNGCSVDDMITIGQTEMTGTLEFEHRGSIYRVVRTRSKKTKAGKSTLELFRLRNEEWIPESGTTISETQAKIKELLGLDAETFTASSMILQGRANEFTSKPPAQRKAILQDILGLDIYDWLQERAKKQYQVKTAELEQLKGKIAQLKKQMGETSIESLRALLADTQTAITLHEAEIEALETQLQETLTKVAQIQAKQSRAKDLEEQAETLKEEIVKRQQTIKQEKAAIGQEESLLVMAQDIQERASKYEQIRALVADIEPKQIMLRNLETEYKASVDSRAAQQGKAAQLGPQIDELKHLLAQRESLGQDAIAHQQAEARLQIIEKMAEEYADRDIKLRKAQDNYDIARREYDAKINEMTNEITFLRNKTSMLENANCVDPVNASCRFLKDAQEAKLLLPGKAKELADYMGNMEVKLAEFKEVVDQALTARANVGYDHQEHSKVSDKVRTLKPSLEKLAQLDIKAELLKNLTKQQEEYLQAAEEADKQAQIKWDALNTLRGELLYLEAQEARLPELMKWAELLPKLNNAQAAIDASNKRIATLQNEILTRQTQAASKRQEAAEIKAELAQIEQINPATIKAALNKAREIIKTEQAHAVRLQAQLEKVAAMAAECADITAQTAPLSKDAVRWQTLSRAFGRDGVPAMIIDCAVPELESIANDILGQMTRGKNSLFFNTQRDKKNGQGIIETLDIMISDWECPQGRPYETFSGGEQLRIDFALRFALAELLARRAGSRVEWLTIDEGLGSQDREHRELVLEAIRNVAGRFKKVILITHIEDAQGFFEEQIVVRREEGKQYAMSAL
jgi:exonuclease SbcC